MPPMRLLGVLLFIHFCLLWFRAEPVQKSPFHRDSNSRSCLTACYDDAFVRRFRLQQLLLGLRSADDRLWQSAVRRSRALRGEGI